MITTEQPLNVAAARRHFRSLRREVDGQPLVYFDGPGGTQAADACIDAMSAYLGTSNANTHGPFATSLETEAILDEAHAAAADFLGAADPAEICFGLNMTTLTFAASRAIGRTLRPGDEIVVTRLDHDANVAPWLALQEERGAVIRWVEIRAEDCTLDLDGLGHVLGPRTRLVAVGLASNAVGTINPVSQIAEMVHSVGARLWVDAVHAAPHLPIDVAALGADYLVCSAYKFFGPHMGLLWGRRELLEELPAYKVRPAGDELPSRFETGTQSHEAAAGLVGAFRYLAWLGRTDGAVLDEPGDPLPGEGSNRRVRLRQAMERIRAYELSLLPRLIEGLQQVPGLNLRGIVNPARLAERCPTLAFTLAGHTPEAVATFLGSRGIATWHGDYYAWELIRTLGLADSGGMVRVGLVHYNTADEIDRLIAELHSLTG
ncbi:MAG: cysteine desulfurase-like protein [Candidatus Limnocylindrales bacterium]